MTEVFHLKPLKYLRQELRHLGKRFLVYFFFWWWLWVGAFWLLWADDLVARLMGCFLMGCAAVYVISLLRATRAAMAWGRRKLIIEFTDGGFLFRNLSVSVPDSAVERVEVRRDKVKEMGTGVIWITLDLAQLPRESRRPFHTREFRRFRERYGCDCVIVEECFASAEEEAETVRMFASRYPHVCQVRGDLLSDENKPAQGMCPNVDFREDGLVLYWGVTRIPARAIRRIELRREKRHFGGPGEICMEFDWDEIPERQLPLYRRALAKYRDEFGCDFMLGGAWIGDVDDLKELMEMLRARYPDKLVVPSEGLYNESVGRLFGSSRPSRWLSRPVCILIGVLYAMVLLALVLHHIGVMILW